MKQDSGGVSVFTDFFFLYVTPIMVSYYETELM
jgi:hypothetical protein